MKNKKFSASLQRRLLMLFFILALVVIEIAFHFFSAFDDLGVNIYNTAVRFIGGAVCIVFMLEFSYGAALSPLGNKKVKYLIAVLPAFAVAINNFPFVSFFSGDCYIKTDLLGILIFALFCLSVGFFEEMAFRGCVLMFFLKKRSNTKGGIFIAILLSSVAFGLIHLVNLFTASPAAVLLQIGYSALIGGLCSLVLLATKNIWRCVVIHAVYNFAGGIVPEFGGGAIWTASEIILTAVVALIVTIYSVWLFIKLPVSNAGDLYDKNN